MQNSLTAGTIVSFVPNGNVWLSRMPSQVALGVDDQLIKLKSSLAHPELPTIDLDVLLIHIVEALHHEGTAETELFHLPHTLMRYDVLGDRIKPVDRNAYGSSVDDLDDPWDNVLGLSLVLDNAVKMGQQLLRIIREHRLYESQYLQFNYSGILDDRTILLGRRR